MKIVIVGGVAGGASCAARLRRLDEKAEILMVERGPSLGTVMLIFTIVALGIDNFVRPVLIKRGADLPLIMVFAGVIGGLVAFGVIGLFIGPVLLAVTYTLLEAWVTSNGQGKEAVSHGK